MSQRKQDVPFDPARAERLDNPARFAYLPAAEVLALLDVPSGATLLDFGAGTGTYLLAFAALRSDLRLIAYDVQPAMLDLARAKPGFAAHAIATALPGDLARLRGSVDRLFALNVLHEIDDVDLIAMRALLAPDGVALIVDWDAEIDRTVGPPREHAHTMAEAVVRLGAYFTIEQTKRFANHFAIRARASEVAP